MINIVMKILLEKKLEVIIINNIIYINFKIFIKQKKEY